jgi:hypothetical protein
MRQEVGTVSPGFEYLIENVAMKIPTVCLIFFFLTSAGVLLGQPAPLSAEQQLEQLKQTFESKLDAIKERDSKFRLSLDKGYLSSLLSLERELKESGKLEPLLPLREERERFTRDQRVDQVTEGAPGHLKRIQEHYLRRLVELDLARSKEIHDLGSAYAQALKRLQESATKRGEIDGAVNVKAVRAELATHAELIAATKHLEEGRAEQERIRQQKEANEEIRAVLKNYRLIYDLDLAKLGRPVRYDVDESTRFVGEFDRIAYWLELQKPGEETKFVCVSMDAFTDEATKIGVPTTGSQAAFQTNLAKLNVLSNVEGIQQGQDLPGGNIEFWPNKYAPFNGANIPGASGEEFDFGDQKGPLENGYGCMQVHNHAAGHTIFAINNWNAGAKADIGIGNSPGQHRDWTLAGNGEQYQSKRLRILVRPTGKPGKPKELGWERSYAAGKTDVNGQFLGGSEIFHIESHKGKLYAATSYWEDENNTYYSNGKRNQWAQVLVKDSKTSPWREDYDTGDDRGVLRPEILQSVTFTKPNPDVNLLFLATYRTDHSKYYVDIMVRNDATGKWIKTTPHSGPKVPDAHDFSVRAMRVYTDRVTREERIFVTVGIQGVLSGVYDPKVPGWIRWDPLHPVKFSERALSMCEANNSLVIGAGDAVWRREDGRSPSYSMVHDLRDLVDNPVQPAIGGIRGMTTIDNPNGPGDSLLFLWSNADAKGYCGSMYRLDHDGRGGYTRHEDVRLASAVQEELGVHPSFILGAYSYVQPVLNPVTRKINHLVGLYVQLPHGKHAYPTWSDKNIYMGGLFAIRDEKGRYTINEVNGRHNGSDTPLTTVRAIEPSPFRNDTDVYFGGHDCAFRRSTNFAWMYKAPLRTVLRLSKD